MSWMDMTEQGKIISELTLTITVSTPSGKWYLKYWEEGREEDDDDDDDSGREWLERIVTNKNVMKQKSDEV